MCFRASHYVTGMHECIQYQTQTHAVMSSVTLGRCISSSWLINLWNDKK